MGRGRCSELWHPSPNIDYRIWQYSRRGSRRANEDGRRLMERASLIWPCRWAFLRRRTPCQWKPQSVLVHVRLPRGRSIGRWLLPTLSESPVLGRRRRSMGDVIRASGTATLDVSRSSMFLSSRYTPYHGVIEATSACLLLNSRESQGAGTSLRLWTET